MAFFKRGSNTLSFGAMALPIGAVLAAMGGLLLAYLRWFRPGVAAELTAAAAPGSPASSAPPATPREAVELARRFHGLDSQHAATHYPPSLERDPKDIERSIHEG